MKAVENEHKNPVFTSKPDQIPKQITQGQLDPLEAVLLALLDRLPDVVEVLVLGWAPGGLDTRFTTLYAGAIRHMVLSSTPSSHHS